MIRVVLTCAGSDQEAFEVAVIEAGIDIFESCPEPDQFGWIALYLQPEDIEATLARLPKALRVHQEPAADWSGDPAETVVFDKHVIRVEPGLSFGTGTHPTTALTLEWISELRPQTMLDVGCGSGVLSIAAAKLGARVTALDIDAEAIRASQHNRELNAVVFDLVHGPVGSVRGRFSLVAANLLAVTLLGLWSELRALGDTLIVSGILAEQESEFLSAIPETPAEVRRREDWIAIRFATV